MDSNVVQQMDRPSAPGRNGGALDQNAGWRIAVVDDDPLFRESIAENLRDENYTVQEFADGASCLAELDPDAVDLVLLDWRMPGLSGIETLHKLRGNGLEVPVIFITVLGDQLYEEAALKYGAVDFVEKSRSLSIVRRRIELALQNVQPRDSEPEIGEVLRVGPLDLRRRIARAYWDGDEVPLTLTEYRVVERLAARAGQDVHYRDLYDQVHGEGFFAGTGEEGYRGNVRTLIKRIRQKFRALDPHFDAIENYPGFGYRWRPGDERRG